MSQSYFSPQQQRSPSSSADDFVYIFPNPPSSSPSLSSASSLVDTTVHHISRPRFPLQDRGPSRSEEHLCLPFTTIRREETGGDQDIVTWISVPDGGSDQRALPGRHDERVNRWEHVYRRRTARARRSHSLSLIRSDPSHSHLAADTPRVTPPRSRRISEISFDATYSPHPKMHIPLLSFFLSFLSLDDTILHLLTHSATDSVLFPGHTLTSDDTLVDGNDAPVHGMSKWLMSTRECASVKEGCTVMCDPSVASSSFRLDGLRTLFTGALDKGQIAIRRIWS